MTDHAWEAYAIRYGWFDRPAQGNFLMPVADPHESMPLDYYVWLLRNPATGHDIVVDTGFDEACAATVRTREALAADPARVASYRAVKLRASEAAANALRVAHG